MFRLLLLSSLAWAGPRLVSTSPQVTELLFQLGRGQDCVATSHFSDYPEAAKSLPRIGPPFAYGVEAIARFSPDWVLTEPNAAPPGIERALAALGVRHFSVPVPTVESVYGQSERILKEIYSKEKTEMPPRVKLPRASEPFIFLAFAWLDPPILFGHTTFLSDLITQVGGKNLFPAGWNNPYPKVSLEWLLKQEVSRVYFIAYADQTVEKGATLTEHWWPGKKVKFIPLREHFSRATFTALRHAGELLP